MDIVFTKEVLTNELAPEVEEYLNKNIFEPVMAGSCLDSKIAAWTIWSIINDAKIKRQKELAEGEAERAKLLERIAELEQMLDKK